MFTQSKKENQLKYKYLEKLEQKKEQAQEDKKEDQVEAIEKSEQEKQGNIMTDF